MKYNEFVEKLNAGKIRKVTFSVPGYAHYKKCVIEYTRSDPSRSDSLAMIWFFMTEDGYEKYGFIEKYKENTKLFDFKKRGKFTLAQIWRKISIESIEYNEN